MVIDSIFVLFYLSHYCITITIFFLHAVIVPTITYSYFFGWLILLFFGGFFYFYV